MQLKMPDARTCVYVIVGMTALAASVAGMSSSAVVTTMNRHKASAMRIKTLMRDPRNAECVEARQRKVAAVEHECNAVQRYLSSVHGRRPLIDGVLPVARSDAERYAFAEAYAAAIVSFADQLGAAGPAGPAEVAIAQREVDELRAWLAEQDGDEIRLEHPARSAVIGEFGGPRSNSSNYKGRDQRFDATLRANVDRARHILCYAQTRSFHISPVIGGRRPSMEEIWHAQVGLWIQQDLVEAVARLNHEAAAAQSDREAHVQYSPVKRIIEVEILGYHGDGSTIPFASIDDRRSRGFGEARLIFKPLGDGYVDVVRFRVALIVDQRDLLEVVDRIVGENLYRCLNLSFQTPKDERDAGYLYGSEPVVCAQLYIEAYFARELFEPLMPEEVLRRLGGRRGDGG